MTRMSYPTIGAFSAENGLFARSEAPLAVFRYDSYVIASTSENLAVSANRPVQL